MLIFQGETEEPGNDRIFKYHPLLKNHSNQEHYNSIHHPYLTESIEELVEWINHYIPVWRLAVLDCFPHVYLFLAESLNVIMDLHPLLIFVWLIPYPMRDPIYS